MNFNSYFTIKHTSNLRILLLTLFFIVPLGTIYGQNQLITIAGKNITLLKAFDALLLHGHSVIVIEHNLDVAKCADNIIDLGPEGGNNGGQLIFEGTPEDCIKCSNSITGKYLKEKFIN